MSTTREVIDCRWFPTERPCDVAISGNEEEVLNIAVQHAVQSHHQETPELREQLRSLLRDEEKRKLRRPRNASFPKLSARLAVPNTTER